jgi:hypothetical protein
VSCSNLVQRLNEEAISNKHANEKKFTDWLQSHNAEAVYRSNLAASRLRGLRKREKLNIKVPHTLRDPRQLKRPLTSYALFFQEKVGSGVMHGLKIGEVGKLVGQEWKESSPLEKQVGRC